MRSEDAPMAEVAARTSSSLMKLICARMLTLMVRPAFQRMAIAEIFGYLGDENDCAMLLRMMTESNEAREQSAIATALGHLGSRDAIDGLFEIIGDTKRATLVRAAAIESLGQMLSENSRYVLKRLAGRSNYATLPDWFRLATVLTL